MHSLVIVEKGLYSELVTTGLSIKNLGPIAIGFTIILLSFVMYRSIRQVGGSWAGAAIALGASIIVAKLLQLRVP